MTLKSEIKKSLRENEQVLTTGEVANFLRVNLSSVRRWSRTGKLKGYRLGGQGDWRYLKSDVLAFFYNYSNGKLLHEGGVSTDPER